MIATPGATPDEPESRPARMSPQRHALVTGTAFAFAAGLMWGLVFIAPTLLAEYPPASIANMTGRQYAFNRGGRVFYRQSWYERGYGPKWIRKRDGVVKGRRTSETLSKRWTLEAEDDGLTQVVGNNDTYARFVHDPAKQAKFHAARGWQNTEQVWESEGETMVDFIAAQFDKAFK